MLRKLKLDKKNKKNMKQYKELLAGIITEGVVKPPAREGMPNTISLFGTRMEFDLAKGFPLLTTKKMYYKSIFVELLWFLKGDTNIKYLVDNGCNIWNKDAYRWYLKQFKAWNNGRRKSGSCEPLSLAQFTDAIKHADIEEWFDKYNLGDLGKVYGHQWRNQNGVDQLQVVIDRIKNEPFGRYAILDAWNPSDFSEMALPPCHLLYQFNCRMDGEYMTLDLQMYQRSCDTFLGVPFNIASASLLLRIIAEACNMTAGKLVWVGGDTHVYDNHLDQVSELLERDPMELCQLTIGKELSSLDDILGLKLEDLVVSNYKSHPPIKAELSVGLKKEEKDA